MKNFLKNRKVRNFLKVVFLIFWLGVIYFFSSIPNLLGEASFHLEVIIRKWAHFFEFGLLTFLLYKVISLRSPEKFRRNLWLAVILAVSMSALDEFHQSFVMGRSGRMLDVMIDSFGVITVAWLIILEREHQDKHPRKEHFIKI